jgi:hypothetical protein
MIRMDVDAWTLGVSMLEQRSITLATAKKVLVSWFTRRPYASAEMTPISIEVSYSWNAVNLEVQIARL